MNDDLGPLRALVGTWEGEEGVDSAFSHARGEVVSTPYRERTTFTLLGSVRNGDQHLVGLDYRTEMWRREDGASFHAEVGYWLWDAANGEVLRAFVVPRGVTVLAGGPAEADSTELTLRAGRGEAGYVIGENRYLTSRASALDYQVTISAHADGTWSYDEATVLRIGELSDPFAHTDRNTLHRIA